MLVTNGRQIAVVSVFAGAGFFGGWLVSPRWLAEQGAPVMQLAIPATGALTGTPTPGSAWIGPEWIWQWYLAILLGVVLAAMLWSLRRLKHAAVAGHKNAAPARGSERASANPWAPDAVAAGKVETAAAPRELLSNPWQFGDASLTFDDRVRLAVEGSLRSSRVLGVIYLAVRTGAESTRIAARISDEFRAKLRRTDHVKIETGVNGSLEISVFAPLLRSRSELAIIAERLMTAARRIAIDCKQLQLDEPGLAMYPIDGYECDELIASARANAQGDTCCISREGVVQLAKRRSEILSN